MAFFGIFKDKYITKLSAWADTEELVMPEYRTNIVKQYLLGAIHQDLDIAQAIKASVLAGYSQKYRKFIKKSLNTDLAPTRSTFNKVRDEDLLTVENIIKSLYGSTAEIDAIELDIVNPRYFAYKWLYQNWVDAAGVVWKPTNTTVAIDYIDPDDPLSTVVRYNVPNDPNVTYNQILPISFMIGISFTVFLPNPNYPGLLEPEYLEYIHEVADVSIQDLTTAVVNWDNIALLTLYHVVIKFTDNSDRFEFWEYDLNDTAHPSLTGSASIWGTWSSAAILYQDTQPFYNQSWRVELVRDLLDIFGLDADEVVDSLIKEIPPILPSGTTFTDAFILFGLVPDFNIESHNKYVIEFIKATSNATGGSFNLGNEYYDGINSTIIIGGATGYVYSMTLGAPITYEKTTEYKAPGYFTLPPPINPLPFNINAQGVRFTAAHKDPGYWETVTYGGVRGNLLINNSDGNTCYAGLDAYIHLNSLALDQLNNKDLEEIFQASLRIITAGINVQTIKIPWYTRGVFKIILIVVTLILVFITKTPAFLNWLAVAISSAQVYVIAVIALQTLTAAMIGITSSIVIGGIAGKLIGAFLTYGYIGGFTTLSSMNFSIDRMWNNLFTFNGFGNILSILKKVSEIYLYKQQLKLQKDFRQDLKEYTDLMSSLKQKQQELEDTILSLEKNNNIDPWMIYRWGPNILYSESPKDFYERKLDQNPGIGTLKLIQDYAKLSLNLPEGTGHNPALSLNALPTPGVLT